VGGGGGGGGALVGMWGVGQGGWGFRSNIKEKKKSLKVRYEYYSQVEEKVVRKEKFGGARHKFVYSGRFKVGTTDRNRER